MGRELKEKKGQFSSLILFSSLVYLQQKLEILQNKQYSNTLRKLYNNGKAISIYRFEMLSSHFFPSLFQSAYSLYLATWCWSSGEVYCWPRQCKLWSLPFAHQSFPSSSDTNFHLPCSQFIRHEKVTLFLDMTGRKASTYTECTLGP